MSNLRRSPVKQVLQNMPSVRELQEQRTMRIRYAIERMKMNSRAQLAFTPQETWQIPKPPPGVVPQHARMAMDDATGSYVGWAQNFSAFAEGQAFLGYPYLSELAQRPEYRVINETWAQEMTRKWIRLVSTGDAKLKDKSDKLKHLTDVMEKLHVQECFRKCVEIDGSFGRAQIYVDLGVDSQDRDELKTSIGDGTSRLSRVKVRKGSLKNLKVIEPVWTYPNSYNANDPLKPDFFKPKTWFVMGQEIHHTRLLTFIGRPVPDLLKPMYSFGGLSLSQMAKPYIDNWLRTRQSVSDGISNFSIMILLTDLSTMLDTGAMVDLTQRADLFNVTRDNRGLMLADKNTEDLKNVSMPLSGLDHLQAQAQEHMCVSKGTLIETDRGQVPVEEVTLNDRVMTRNGYAPVAWSGISKYASHFVEIETECSILRVTEEHPIWAEKINEFVNAGSVDHTHHLRKSRAWESTENLLRGEEGYGAKPKQDITVIQKLAGCCIELFTKHILEKFQQVLTYITGMKTLATIAYPILSYCHVQSTQQNTNHVDGRVILGRSLRRGVKNVKNHISHHGLVEHVSVPMPARIDHGSGIIQITGTRKINAEVAEPVYDVSVADGYLPEFFANGILVHNSSVSQIPLVKLTGISPSGLNATSEWEVKVFYDKVEAQQKAVLSENLTTLLRIIQLSEYGEVDPEIGFEYEQLHGSDATEEAEVFKSGVDSDVALINAGVISPLESRTRIADDASSPYASLSTDEADLPVPPNMQMPGGETDEHGNSIGGEHNDLDNPAPTQGAVAQGNTKSDTANKPIQSKPVPGAHDSAEFVEEEHPRNADGEFTDKGSEGKGVARHSPKKDHQDGSHEKLKLHHYSTHAGIQNTEPAYYGEGTSGGESKRREQDPDNWVDRTYFYVGEHKKESMLGNNEYTAEIDPAELYDYASDPENLSKSAKSGENSINLYEKAIKDAGYAGYFVDNDEIGKVAAVFKPLPVEKEDEEGSTIKLSGGSRSTEADKQKARDFLNDLADSHYRNPVNEAEIVIGNAAVELHRNLGNSVHLNFIRSFEQGKGNASKALSVVCDYADKHNIKLDLEAAPMPQYVKDKKDALSKKELFAWYGRHGFKRVSKRGWDDYMVREPQSKQANDDADFEAKHPRGQPENAGEFAKTPGEAWPGLKEHSGGNSGLIFALLKELPKGTTANGVTETQFGNWIRLEVPTVGAIEMWMDGPSAGQWNIIGSKNKALQNKSGKTLDTLKETLASQEQSVSEASMAEPTFASVLAKQAAKEDATSEETAENAAKNLAQIKEESKGENCKGWASIDEIKPFVECLHGSFEYVGTVNNWAALKFTGGDGIRLGIIADKDGYELGGIGHSHLAFGEAQIKFLNANHTTSFYSLAELKSFMTLYSWRHEDPNTKKAARVLKAWEAMPLGFRLVDNEQIAAGIYPTVLTFHRNEQHGEETLLFDMTTNQWRYTCGKHNKNNTGLDTLFDFGESYDVMTEADESSVTKIHSAEKPVKPKKLSKPAIENLKKVFSTTLAGVGYELNPTEGENGQWTTPGGNDYLAWKTEGEGTSANHVVVILSGHNKGKWISKVEGHGIKMGEGESDLLSLINGDKDALAKTSSLSQNGIGAFTEAVFHVADEPDGEKPAPHTASGLKKPSGKVSGTGESAKLFNKLAKGRPAMSEVEQEAIYAYTDGEYGGINTDLRSGSAHAAGKRNVQALTGYLQKAELPEECTLYRSVHGEYATILKSILVDDGKIIDHGFISMSTGKHNFGGNELRFEIKMPKGAHAMALGDVGNHESEHEVIGQRDSIFHITKFDRDKNTVECEWIPGSHEGGFNNATA